MAPKKNKRSVKPPKNARYYFLLEFKQVRGQSIAHLTSDEIVNIAAKEYNNLTDEERRKYQDQAERASSEKYNSLGIPISVQEQFEQDKKNRSIGMKNEIKSLVESLAIDLEELKTKCFYFLHINCFVRTEKGYVVPAEIALVEFSLKYGVQRQYNEFLHVRNIPPGYSCTARDIAEKTHKIPCAPFLDIANTDAANVWENVNRFINGRGVDDESPYLHDLMDPPIMFTACREMEIVSDCYGAIIAETGIKGGIVVKIYPIEVLYHHLQLLCCQVVGAAPDRTPTLAVAEIDFERDKNSYAEFIACQFHDEQDERPNCSRSKVIRWGYTIADYVCGPLDIKMIPLLHYPQSSLRQPIAFKTLEDAQYNQYVRREQERLAQVPLRLAGRGRGMYIPMSRPPGVSSAPLPSSDSVKKEQFEDSDDDDDWKAVEVPQPPSAPVSTPEPKLGARVNAKQSTNLGEQWNKRDLIDTGKPAPYFDPNSFPDWTTNSQCASEATFNKNVTRSSMPVDTGDIDGACYVAPEQKRRTQSVSSRLFNKAYDDAIRPAKSVDEDALNMPFYGQRQFKEETAEDFMPLSHRRRQMMQSPTPSVASRAADMNPFSFESDMGTEALRRYHNMSTPCPSVMSEPVSRPASRPASATLTSAAAATAAIMAENRCYSRNSVSLESNSSFGANYGVNENLVQAFQSRARGRGISPESFGRSNTPSGPNVDRRQPSDNQDLANQFSQFRI